MIAAAVTFVLGIVVGFIWCASGLPDRSDDNARKD